MRVFHRSASCIAASLLLLGTGCTLAPSRTAPVEPVPSEPVASGPEGDLAAARARWAAAGLARYTMTETRQCECLEETSGPFRVTVRDGAVADVQFQGRAVAAGRALSIDALFDRLAQAYAEGAPRVDAAYHPTLGYPTHFIIDLDERIADEEVSYSVRDVAAE